MFCWCLVLVKTKLCLIFCKWDFPGLFLHPTSVRPRGKCSAVPVSGHTGPVKIF